MHSSIKATLCICTVLLKAYTAFMLGNDLKVLFSSIRSGLDTMVYEDVFDALAYALPIASQKFFISRNHACEAYPKFFVRLV